MKIIIIEDEGITRQWLKKKIEELSGDYHVEGVFSNGKQALDYLLSQRDVDVVFTDIRMPVMDGLVFLEKLLELGLKPYKIILSAYDEFQYARQAMRLGAQEFVLKPEITKESLKQILIDAAHYLKPEQKTPEKEAKAPLSKSGAAFAELLKRDSVDMDALAAVFGENGKKDAFSHLVIADIYWERPVSHGAVEELLELFLEQEQLQGAFFWSDGQQLILGYLHSNTAAERMELMGRLFDILQAHTGVKLYLGISRIPGDGNVRELYRQAATARENRVFFELPGAQQYDDMRISMNQEPGELYFNQDIREIMEYLHQADYAMASEKTELFLDNVKKASYLHPAYVKALCDEVLSAYRHSLWEYSLSEEEKKRIGGAEQLLDKESLRLEQLINAVKGELEHLCGLLQKKRESGQYSPPVKAVMQYIEAHLGERISLEQAADAVFLSRPYLSTLFKKETGKKFSTYLQEMRLQKSCTMLKDTRLSVGEIAEQTGFFDSAHFSKAFKEHYGCSPLEYRKTK